jgi:hypothetical protein
MLSRLSIVGVCRQKRLAAKAWHPANFVAHQTSNFSRLPRKRFHFCDATLTIRSTYGFVLPKKHPRNASKGGVSEGSGNDLP